MATVPQSQLCTNCHETKPVAEFPRDARYNSGFSSWCKRCKNRVGHERLKALPERQRAKSSAKWHRQKGDPEAVARERRRKLKFHYGISPEDFERMKAEQDGKCAICGKVPDQVLRIDHCHRTGQVRGLLCRLCNTAIGLLNDDADLLRVAIVYLERKAQIAG